MYGQAGQGHIQATGCTPDGVSSPTDKPTHTPTNYQKQMQEPTRHSQSQVNAMWKKGQVNAPWHGETLNCCSRQNLHRRHSVAV
jgi:hypothetical protein